MKGISLPLTSSFNRLTHVRRINQTLRGFDVLILNHARYAQAALPGLPSNIVVVGVLHNDAENVYDVGCGNAKAVDALVAVSPKVRDAATARVGQAVVSQIFCGIPDLRASVDGCRAEISTSPRLIFVGRMDHAQKGIFLLPEILIHLNQAGVHASLDVAGDGPDLSEVENRTARAGLDEQVRYLGTLSAEHVAKKLREAHILLMPSFYEGFPTVPLEAQACGCVPVISYLPGITEPNVLGGVTGVFAECGNPKSFADGVLSLVNNPATWQSMSEAGMRRIRDEFSVEKMGGNYLALIERIRAEKQCAGKGPRSGLRWNPKLIGYTAPLPTRLCQALNIL
jgi:glycosyltransferase involved in cell wall biosynthesis